MEHREIHVEDVMRILGCAKTKAYGKLKRMRSFIGHREFYTFLDFETWRTQGEPAMTQQKYHGKIEEACTIIIDKHSNPKWRKIANPKDPEVKNTIKKVCKEHGVKVSTVKRILLK